MYVCVCGGGGVYIIKMRSYLNAAFYIKKNNFFQLSRIVLDSKNPNWQKADLRMTRLKEPERGELLIFKEVSASAMTLAIVCLHLTSKITSVIFIHFRFKE